MSFNDINLLVTIVFQHAIAIVLIILTFYGGFYLIINLFNEISGKKKINFPEEDITSVHGSVLHEFICEKCRLYILDEKLSAFKQAKKHSKICESKFRYSLISTIFFK